MIRQVSALFFDTQKQGDLLWIMCSFGMTASSVRVSGLGVFYL